VGNVQGENAQRVELSGGSHVGGSVQVKQGGGASVLDSQITGDIQYDANTSGLEASRNRVGGSVQVFQNRGGVRICRQHDRRQPAMQGERATTNRWRKRRPGQQGGPVRAPVMAPDWV